MTSVFRPLNVRSLIVVYDYHCCCSLLLRKRAQESNSATSNAVKSSARPLPHALPSRILTSPLPLLSDLT